MDCDAISGLGWMSDWNDADDIDADIGIFPEAVNREDEEDEEDDDDEEEREGEEEEEERADAVKVRGFLYNPNCSVI